MLEVCDERNRNYGNSVRDKAVRQCLVTFKSAMIQDIEMFNMTMMNECLMAHGQVMVGGYPCIWHAMLDPFSDYWIVVAAQKPLGVPNGEVFFMDWKPSFLKDARTVIRQFLKSLVLTCSNTENSLTPTAKEEDHG